MISGCWDKLTNNERLGTKLNFKNTQDGMLFLPVRVTQVEREEKIIENFFRQQEIGELLQFQPSDFVDFESYQRKLHELYPTEQDLVEHLFLSFPGELEVTGGGLTIDSNTTVKTLLRQMIQRTIVSAVCRELLEDVNDRSRVLYPDGEDAVGLRRLDQARQQTVVQSDPLRYIPPRCFPDAVGH